MVLFPVVGEIFPFFLLLCHEKMLVAASFFPVLMRFRSLGNVDFVALRSFVTLFVA